MHNPKSEAAPSAKNKYKKAPLPAAEIAPPTAVDASTPIKPLKQPKPAKAEINSFTRQYEPGVEPELIFILRLGGGPVAGLIKNRVNMQRAGMVRPGPELDELVALCPVHPFRVRSTNGGSVHSAPVRFALFFPEYREAIETAYPASRPILKEEMVKAQRFKLSDTSGVAPKITTVKLVTPRTQKPKGSDSAAPKRPRPLAFDRAAAYVEEPEKPLNIKKPVVDLDRVFRDRKGVTP